MSLGSSQAFCAQCGADRSADAAFCAKCGAKSPRATTDLSRPTFEPPGPAEVPTVAHVPVQAPVAPPTVPPTSSPASPPRPRSRTFGLILAAALIVAGGGGFAIGLTTGGTTMATTTTAPTTTSTTNTTVPAGDPAGLLAALADQGPVLHSTTIATPNAYFAMVVLERDNSGEQIGSGALHIWKLNADGWTEESRLDTGGPIYDWRVADFTGDGVQDFLAIWTPGVRFRESLATSAACSNSCWLWAQFSGFDPDEGATTTDELNGDLQPTGGGPLGNVTLEINTCEPSCADGASDFVKAQWSPTNKRFEG